ncbi:MAG: DNA mismatch repair endonuclease MutL [Chloroflexi bacterium]|nr:DNA mismatch repair endonuclease MutL [Chloroflexota bacterium]
MPIHILPPDVADKIAAGEVVERPASVVKELIENSLDAGATDIRVEIRGGGKRLIRVIDNGCGMSAQDATLAFQRHATSKLRDAADLEHIETLGFRGEALAAIAAVSKTTLITRSADEPVGIELKLESSELVARRSVGGPVGTSITVEHLFWNTPARLKFLRTDATEAGRISQIITRYALAYPEVRFAYVTEGRLAFQSTGSGDRMETLMKVYGHEIAREMLPVEEGEDVIAPGIRVSGFVSKPSLHRANRRYIELFVNRRYIQDKNLTFAVVRAYHTMLPEKRFPIAALFIEMAPTEVDVNVHPTKAEVRFRQASLVFRAVQRAVHRALVEHSSVVGLGLEPEEGSRAMWAARREPEQRPEEPDQLRMDLMQAGLSTEPDSKQSRAEVGSASEIAATRGGAKLPPLRPVGQVSAMFLVAEGPDGLYLIDQHAAHERILYEKIVAAGENPIPTQQLLEPMVIELGTQLAGAVAQHLPTLQQSGFDIELFGGGSFLLRGVPAFMSGQDPRRLLEEVADGLSERADLVGRDREDALVRIICKRLAIKAGQTLSLAEQRELLRQLEACENPLTCPHGRPTILHFSARQLERQFGRT